MSRRDFNEQIDRVVGSLGGPAAYYCECADPACERTFLLERDAYRAIRKDAEQLLVADGHERQGREEVVVRGDGYLVVRRSPEPWRD